MKKLIKELGIKASVLPIHENPLNPEWSNANHYSVKLSYGCKTYVTYISQGLAIKTKPTAYSTLCILQREVITQDSFEEYCDDYGIDSDSLSEYRMFELRAKQTAALKRFFGSNYDTFLSAQGD